MIRKFAFATIFAAVAITVAGLISSAMNRSSSAATTPGASAASAQTATDLAPVQGLAPLPEIIAFWQDRAERNPLDYPSRTQLGYTLNARATEQADVDLYVEAEQAFRDALSLNPNHDHAVLGLAATLIAQHRFDEAATHATLVLGEDRGSLSALALLGDARLGAGDYDGAETAYEELVSGERSAATVARLARLRTAQGRSTEAVALAAEALQLSEDLAVRKNTAAFYHFQLGHALFADGRNEEAIAAHRSALAIDSSHPGASEELAFVLGASGRLDEASKLYDRILADGQAADIHGLYADVLRLAGRDLDAAEQERLGRALAAESLQGPAAERRHLADYYMTRDPEQAVRLAAEDLTERQDIGAYDTLAWALHNAGRSDDAIEVIEQALAFGSRDAAVHYHAAAIHAATGDDATARTQLGIALDINPRFHPIEAGDAVALQTTLNGS